MYSSDTKTEINVISNEIKNQLRNTAILKHGIILPINNTVESIYDEKSYSIVNKNNEILVLYWYSDINNSSHIEYIKISNN